MARLLQYLDRPALLLAFTTFIWATNAIASRLAVGHMSPMVLTTLRWSGTLIIFALIARSTVAADWPTMRSRWKFLFAMGAVGFTGFNALFYLAAHYTTAINIGIIQGSMPAMILIGAWLAFQTPIAWLQTAGIVTTMGGVVMLATRGHPETLATLTFNFGDVLMLAGCLAYSIYTIALRLRPAIAPMSFFTAVCLAALVTSLPLMAIEIARGEAFWPTPWGFALAIYIAIFPGFVAQLLFMRSVEQIGPGRAGLFLNLVPVWAVLLGPIVLGEIFAWYHAAALVLVLGGIAIAERAKPQA